ncbi:MAG: hypothetical protein ACTSXD_02070 [Candidatus Heimdallarchaeaceae archaeon]
MVDCKVINYAELDSSKISGFSLHTKKVKSMEDRYVVTDEGEKIAISKIVCYFDSTGKHHINRLYNLK